MSNLVGDTRVFPGNRLFKLSCVNMDEVTILSVSKSGLLLHISFELFEFNAGFSLGFVEDLDQLSDTQCGDGEDCFWARDALGFGEFRDSRYDDRVLDRLVHDDHTIFRVFENSVLELRGIGFELGTRV